MDSADVVRDLGVWLDSELTVKHHILARSFLLVSTTSEVVAAPRRGHTRDHEAAGDVASTESYRLL